MVRRGTALADVGTDHAYLPIWLARQGRIRSAVASDIRPGPLDRAQRDIERYGAGGVVTARLSDGLDNIRPNEADDIVIAGMGGLMIAEIVGRAAWLEDPEKRLILQPMTRAEDLRRSLAEQGFAVVHEQAVREENHLYTVMLCRWDPECRAFGELFPYIGSLTAETPEGCAYLRHELKRIQNREKGLQMEGDAAQAEKLAHIYRMIAAMLPEHAKLEE